MLVAYLENLPACYQTANNAPTLCVLMGAVLVGAIALSGLAKLLSY